MHCEKVCSHSADCISHRLVLFPARFEPTEMKEFAAIIGPHKRIPAFTPGLKEFNGENCKRKVEEEIRVEEIIRPREEEISCVHDFQLPEEKKKKKKTSEIAVKPRRSNKADTNRTLTLHSTLSITNGETEEKIKA